ncbi:hypothetical protein [Burkholderia vietnamiensis]|nr:hypothetical protein [Burkholderia vietnamiensis]
MSIRKWIAHIRTDAKSRDAFNMVTLEAVHRALPLGGAAALNAQGFDA